MLLYANMWGTYHRKGYLINECSWILTAALPNLSAVNETSKLYSDMLDERLCPEEACEEEIEMDQTEENKRCEKHGLMISLQRNALLTLCLLISV